MKKEKKENTLARELTKQFTRHTGVLLEQIRSEGRAVAEGHGQLARQIEELREDVDQLKENMDQRFIGVQVKMQAMAKGLKSVEGEIQEVKKELREFKGEMQEFKGEMQEFKGEMQEFKGEMQEFQKKTGQQFERVEGTLGAVLQDHEKTITRVEEKLAV